MVRPTKFEISRSGERARVTLAVVGELDMNTVPRLSASVDEQLQNGAGDLTLDLRELSFMDSSGLRLLIELHDQARRDGWGLRLIAPRDEGAALVLRATGADARLPFEDGAAS